MKTISIKYNIKKNENQFYFFIFFFRKMNLFILPTYHRFYEKIKQKLKWNLNSGKYGVEGFDVLQYLKNKKIRTTILNFQKW